MRIDGPGATGNVRIQIEGVGWRTIQTGAH